MTIIGLGPHGERASPPERVTLLPQDIAAARAKGLRVALVMQLFALGDTDFDFRHALVVKI